MIDDELAFAGRDKCAVVGIGQTAFSRDSGRSVLSLALVASLLAACGSEHKPTEPSPVEVRRDGGAVSAGWSQIPNPSSA